MQTSEIMKDWIRWITIFFLVAFGIAVMTGLDMSQRDRSPSLFFIGWFLSVALFVVLPGALLGGIIALATKRSSFGLVVLIFINAIAALGILYGSFI